MGQGELLTPRLQEFPSSNSPLYNPGLESIRKSLGKNAVQVNERSPNQPCLVSDAPGQSGRNDPAKPNRLRQGDLADGPGRLHRARGVPQYWQTFRPLPALPGWKGPDRSWKGNVTHFSLMPPRSNQPPSARAGRASVPLITREIQIGLEWAANASAGQLVTRV